MSDDKLTIGKPTPMMDVVAVQAALDAEAAGEVEVESVVVLCAPNTAPGSVVSALFGHVSATGTKVYLSGPNIEPTAKMLEASSYEVVCLDQLSNLDDIPEAVSIAFAWGQVSWKEDLRRRGAHFLIMKEGVINGSFPPLTEPAP